MFFAQRNYPQHLGNSQLPISEVGCLLTAFCNGLEKINGTAPDPPTLNQTFLERGVFIYDKPDRAFDDLAWNSISHYDPSIVVTSIANGPVPPSNLAAVKFHYTGIHSGLPVDHYCWVDRVENGRVFIIDSWDGVIKSPEQYEPVYHKPVSYATYVKNAPATSAVPAPTPAAPLRAPSLDDVYNIIRTVPGYLSSGTAAARHNSNSQVPEGSYHVYNRFNGMINITRLPGQPGWWVNPSENVPDAPPAPAPVAPALPPEPAPEPPKEPDWRTTYEPFRNKFGDVIPKYYVAMKDIVVTDLEQKHGDLRMGLYNVVAISGTFTKDGITYGRPKSGADKFLWYGIPLIDPMTGASDLELYSAIYDTSTNTVTRKVTKTLKPYDYAVLTAASLEKAYDKLEKVFDVFKPRKVKK